MGTSIQFGTYKPSEKIDSPSSSPNVYLECSKIKELTISQKILLRLRAEGESETDWFGGGYEMELIPSDNDIKLSTAKWSKIEKGWILKTYVECAKETDGYLQVKVDGEIKNKIHLRFKKSPKDIFSEEEIIKIKTFLKDNAGKHETSAHKDCITTVNHTLKLLYNDNNLPVGSQMTGIDMNGRSGTMEKISAIQKIKSQFTVDYIDKQGRVCKKGTPFKANEMQEKFSDKIDLLVGGNVGYYIFGLSIMDGYHSIV